MCDAVLLSSFKLSTDRYRVVQNERSCFGAVCVAVQDGMTQSRVGNFQSLSESEQQHLVEDTPQKLISVVAQNVSFFLIRRDMSSEICSFPLHCLNAFHLIALQSFH